MTKKLILTSKLIFFTEDNELIKENLWISDLFNKAHIVLAIVAKNSTLGVLKASVPEEYKEKLKFLSRGKDGQEKVKSLKKKDVIAGMIGIVEEDAIFSFQSKIPLFNPEELSEDLIVSEKVRKYGLPIFEFENIIDCFKAYEIHKDNYFQMFFEDSFSVISLNNANTYHRPEEEARIKEIFETNLKGSKRKRNQRILLLLLFHLVNEVTTNPFYEKVNYWGTFPSSNPDNRETTVSFLKEAVRVIIGGGPQKGPEILIRERPMQSKHSSGTTRLINKSNIDFETLVVNPDLKKKIKGKVICIIDDYITNGYSAEATKHLLLNAGAKEVIFLSFGKFGRKYYSTKYEIEGDVCDKYEYEFISEHLYDGNTINEKYYDFTNDTEILKFADLL